MLETVEQYGANARDDAAAEVSGRIARCFRNIAATRMSGIPILNPALRVEVVGLRKHGSEWLSILITPWFMNIMLLPIGTARETLDAPAGAPSEARHELEPDPKPAQLKTPGSKDSAAFPSGSFEMIYGFEPELGSYRMCSLFSPVLEFADQESAVAAAEAALEAIMLAEAEDAVSEDAGMEMIWRGERPPRLANEDESVPTDVSGVRKTSEAGALVAAPLDRRALLFGRKAQGGQS